MAQIFDDILRVVGRTPVVRLNHVARDVPPEVLVKCEYLNPGGSVKDRIGVYMLEQAEKRGEIRPGDTLIEATSGNTGIGLAMAAAVRGYRVIITMPEKMSREKQVTLEALGAEIHRTPTEAAFDDPESHIGVAKRLNKIIPRSRILDQYKNPDNPGVHYEMTANEIIEACDGKLDAFVATAGTGGTLSGIARRIKEAIPDCRIVGVDPVGSIIAGRPDDFVGTYKVEGIGYDFVPDVMHRDLVDEWIKTEDKPSFIMARRLIRREGLMVGGSSGSAVWATLEYAKKMKAGQRILTILPDSIRNYMTKFLDDRWMAENRFVDEPWAQGEVDDLIRGMDRRELITIGDAHKVGEAVRLMKNHGISQLPVLGDDGALEGIVTETDVLAALFDDRCTLDTTVGEVMCRKATTVKLFDPASRLAEVFMSGSVALVVDDKGHLVTLLSKVDLIEHLAGGKTTP
ncbi:MAG: cystathionine beta-synthase [Planctomycetes bacterium]|nr:cystathionine beta-synthase [Planctomycetota bacterium]